MIPIQPVTHMGIISHLQSRKDEFDEGDEGEEAAADGQTESKTGNFPWSGSDRDYSYEELLGGSC